jgi:hypothetical protein
VRHRPILPLVLLLGACSAASPRAAAPTTSTAPRSTTTTAPGTSGPCSGSAPPAAYDHVVVIVMENRGLSQVNGSASAPYVNRLGQECGLATDYSGVSHPSLPNYIAMTSGSTHGISDDAGPNSHRIAGPSIFSLLGAGWRSQQESMPHNCDVSSGGEYATKHNPAVYYTLVRPACMTQDIPMDDASPDVSARYTFITPNLCDDGHDCSTATADHWLSVEVPLIWQSPQYRAGTTALFITWDENDAGGSVVPMYVVAPSVPPGTRVGTPLDHYSLLRTSEELLGLTPLLGAAAGAASMRDAFHL